MCIYKRDYFLAIHNSQRHRESLSDGVVCSLFKLFNFYLFEAPLLAMGVSVVTWARLFERGPNLTQG